MFFKKIHEHSFVKLGMRSLLPIFPRMKNFHNAVNTWAEIHFAIRKSTEEIHGDSKGWNRSVELHLSPLPIQVQSVDSYPLKDLGHLSNDSEG